MQQLGMKRTLMTQAYELKPTYKKGGLVYRIAVQMRC